MRFVGAARSLATTLTASGTLSVVGDSLGNGQITKQALYFRFQFSLITWKTIVRFRHALDRILKQVEIALPPIKESETSCNRNLWERLERIYCNRSLIGYIAKTILLVEQTEATNRISKNSSDSLFLYQQTIEVSQIWEKERQNGTRGMEKSETILPSSIRRTSRDTQRTLTLAATVTEAVTFAPFCCRYQSLHQTRSGPLVLVALITRTTPWPLPPAEVPALLTRSSKYAE